MPVDVEIYSPKAKRYFNLEFPDLSEPPDQAMISNIIKELEAEELNRPTDQGRASTIASGVVRGATSAIPGVIGGLGAIIQSPSLMETADTIEENINEAFPVNPAYRDEFWTGKAPQAIGQAIGMLATGAGSGLLARAGAIARGANTVRAGQIASKAAQTTMLSQGFGMGAREGQQEGEEYGLTGAQAYARILSGALTEVAVEKYLFGMGAEMSLLGRVLGKGAASRGKAYTAGYIMGTEGVEEGVTQLVNDTTTNILTTIEGTQGISLRDMAGRTLESTALGAVAGTVFAGANIVGGKPKETFFGGDMTLREGDVELRLPGAEEAWAAIPQGVQLTEQDVMAMSQQELEAAITSGQLKIRRTQEAITDELAARQKQEDQTGPEWITGRGLERAAQSRMTELEMKAEDIDTSETDMQGNVVRIGAIKRGFLTPDEQRELDQLRKLLSGEEPDIEGLAKLYGKKIKTKTTTTDVAKQAAPDAQTAAVIDTVEEGVAQKKAAEASSLVQPTPTPTAFAVNQANIVKPNQDEVAAIVPELFDNSFADGYKPKTPELIEGQNKITRQIEKLLGLSENYLTPVRWSNSKVWRTADGDFIKIAASPTVESMQDLQRQIDFLRGSSFAMVPEMIVLHDAGIFMLRQQSAGIEGSEAYRTPGFTKGDKALFLKLQEQNPLSADTGNGALRVETDQTLKNMGLYVEDGMVKTRAFDFDGVTEEAFQKDGASASQILASAPPMPGVPLSEFSPAVQQVLKEQSKAAQQVAATPTPATPAPSPFAPPPSAVAPPPTASTPTPAVTPPAQQDMDTLSVEEANALDAEIGLNQPPQPAAADPATQQDNAKSEESELDDLITEYSNRDREITSRISYLRGLQESYGRSGDKGAAAEARAERLRLEQESLQVGTIKVRLYALKVGPQLEAREQAGEALTKAEQGDLALYRVLKGQSQPPQSNEQNQTPPVQQEQSSGQDVQEPRQLPVLPAEPTAQAPQAVVTPPDLESELSETPQPAMAADIVSGLPQQPQTPQQANADEQALREAEGQGQENVQVQGQEAQQAALQEEVAPAVPASTQEVQQTPVPPAVELGEGVDEQAVSFDVDDQLLMRSPFTNEDSSVSFRGVMPDGKAVVWTGKTQMAVPLEWLRRAGEPLPIAEVKAGGADISAIVQESQSEQSVAAPTDRQQPLPKTKDGLIAELVGPIKADYVARQAQQKTINNYKKFSKDELLEMVKDQRARDAEFKHRQEVTSEIIQEIKGPVNEAGTGWVKAIKGIAKANGIEDYSILQGNSRGEEIYRIASWIADRGNPFVNPFATTEQPAAQPSEAVVELTELPSYFQRNPQQKKLWDVDESYAEPARISQSVGDKIGSRGTAFTIEQLMYQIAVLREFVSNMNGRLLRGGDKGASTKELAEKWTILRGFEALAAEYAAENPQEWQSYRNRQNELLGLEAGADVIVPYPSPDTAPLGNTGKLDKKFSKNWRVIYPNGETALFHPTALRAVSGTTETVDADVIEEVTPLTQAQSAIVDKLPELEARDAQRRGLGFDYLRARIGRLPGDQNAYISRPDQKNVGVLSPDGSIKMLSPEESVSIQGEINAFEKRQAAQIDKRMATLREEAKKQSESKLYQLTPSDPVVRRLDGKWINNSTGKPLSRSKNDQRLLSQLENNPNIESYQVVAQSTDGGVSFVPVSRAAQPAAETTTETTPAEAQPTFQSPLTQGFLDAHPVMRDKMTPEQVAAADRYLTTGDINDKQTLTPIQRNRVTEYRRDNDPIEKAERDRIEAAQRKRDAEMARDDARFYKETTDVEALRQRERGIFAEDKTEEAELAELQADPVLGNEVQLEAIEENEAEMAVESEVVEPQVVQRDPSKPEQMTPEESNAIALTLLKKAVSMGGGITIIPVKEMTPARWAKVDGMRDPKYRGRIPLVEVKRLGDIKGDWRGRDASDIAIIDRRATLAFRANLPVEVSAVDTYNIPLPQGYVKQGDLYVFQPEATQQAPIQPVAPATVQEAPAVETSEIEIGDDVTVNLAGRTETVTVTDLVTIQGVPTAYFEYFGTKSRPLAELTLSKKSARNIKQAEQRRANAEQAQRQAEQNAAELAEKRSRWETTDQRTEAHDKAANEAYQKAKKVIENAKKEQAKIKPTATGFTESQTQEYAKQQAKIDKANKVIDNAAKYAGLPKAPTAQPTTPTNDSPVDRQRKSKGKKPRMAIALMEQDGRALAQGVAVPDIKLAVNQIKRQLPEASNMWYGTVQDFLNEFKDNPAVADMVNALQSGDMAEGFYSSELGRGFLFTDTAVTYEGDAGRAKRNKTSPAVEVVKRLLRHEVGGHGGWATLTQAQRERFLRIATEVIPESDIQSMIDDGYPFENWRTDSTIFEMAAEEWFSQQLGRLDALPETGPMARFVEWIKDVWRWLTGNPKEVDPSIEAVKDLWKQIRTNMAERRMGRAWFGVRESRVGSRGTGFETDVVTEQIRNRIKFLEAAIDQGYEAQDYANIENYEAELELLYERAESTLEEMDDADDSENVAEMFDSDMAEFDSANPSPEESLVNAYLRWTGQGFVNQQNMADLRREFASFGDFFRATLGDTPYTLSAETTNQQIEEAAQESTEQYQRRRQAFLATPPTGRYSRVRSNADIASAVKVIAGRPITPYVASENRVISAELATRLGPGFEDLRTAEPHMVSSNPETLARVEAMLDIILEPSRDPSQMAEMTPQEAQQGQDPTVAEASHREAIQNAIALDKPVSASAVAQYGIPLPDSYQQFGELWARSYPQFQRAVELTRDPEWSRDAGMPQGSQEAMGMATLLEARLAAAIVRSTSEREQAALGNLLRASKKNENQQGSEWGRAGQFLGWMKRKLAITDGGGLALLNGIVDEQNKRIDNLIPVFEMTEHLEQQNPAIEQTAKDVTTDTVENEILMLWERMMEEGDSDIGLQIASLLRSLMPQQRANLRDRINGMFTEAGFRERMNARGGELARQFFNILLPGEAQERGALADFDQAVQKALADRLRQIMIDLGMVQENQTTNDRSLEQLVMSLSDDPLRAEKIQRAIAAFEARLEQETDPEMQAALRDAWETVTAQLTTSIASPAVIRRVIRNQMETLGIKHKDILKRFRDRFNPANNVNHNDAVADIREQVLQNVMLDIKDMIEVSNDTNQLEGAPSQTVQDNVAQAMQEVAEEFDRIIGMKFAGWARSQAAVSQKARATMEAALNNTPGDPTNRITNSLRMLIQSEQQKPIADFVNRARAQGLSQADAVALQKAIERFRIGRILQKPDTLLKAMVNKLKNKMFLGATWRDIIVADATDGKERVREIYKRIRLNQQLRGLTQEEAIQLAQALNRQFLNEKAKAIQNELKRFGAGETVIDSRIQALIDKSKSSAGITAQEIEVKLMDIAQRSKHKKLQKEMGQIITRIANGQMTAEQLQEIVGAPRRVGNDQLQRIIDSVPKLVQAMNLGAFNDAAFREAVADKFKMRTITQAEAREAQRLAGEIEKAPKGIPRVQAQNKLLEFLQDKTGLTTVELTLSYWVSSILSGGRTLFDMAFNILNSFRRIAQMAGFLSMSSVGTSQGTAALRRQAAKQSMMRFFQVLPEVAVDAWTHIKTGERAILLSEARETDKALREGGLSSAMDTQRLEFQRQRGGLPGGVATFIVMMRRIMGAMDYMSAAANLEAMVPVAIAMNPNLSTSGKLPTKQDYEIWNQRAQDIITGGRKPTNQREAALVRAQARELMLDETMTQSLRDETTLRANESSYQNDPSGLGGIFYRGVLAAHSAIVSKAQGLVDAGEANAANIDSRALRMADMAWRRLVYYAAVSSRAALGFQFARFAGNKTNELISMTPAIGLLRLAESDKSATKRAQILMDQMLGVMLTAAGLIYYFLEMGDGDEEEEGKRIEGSWANLTVEQTRQLRAAGKEPYTISFFNAEKGTWDNYKYSQWATSGAMAFLGNMSDRRKYTPDLWTTDGMVGMLLAAATSQWQVAMDQSALSQLNEVMGRNGAWSQRDPAAGVTKQMNKIVADLAGGFVPRALKDLDYMLDPAHRKAETGFELWTQHVPFYRRTIGKEYLDSLGNQVELRRAPWSRAYFESGGSPAHNSLAKLINAGVFVSSLNLDNRKIGTGDRVRNLTDSEKKAFETRYFPALQRYLVTTTPELLRLPREEAQKKIRDDIYKLKNQVEDSLFR